MSGYTVSGMGHEQMVQLVRRRLGKLAMCKRGTLQTELNSAIEKHGPRPAYTAEEREAIAAKLASRVQKALTPTVREVKEAGNNLDRLSAMRLRRAKDLVDKAYVHPDVDKWKAARLIIEQQFKEREATLDGDFQDAEDEFVLGIRTIQELPDVYAKMEAMEW